MFLFYLHYCFPSLIKRLFRELVHPVIGEVWQLHRVSDVHSVQERLRVYEITPERLESLIVEYIEKGYEFLPVKDVAGRMSGGKGKPFVCVTLDDGYADNYDVAYPIFRKYSIPFCIYVCEKMVSGERKEDDVENYRMLTTEQIRLLDKDSLCTIGSHTRSHVRLASHPAARQMEEIAGCKEWLEALLGHEVEDFAYPYGDYNSDTVKILCQTGIKRAVAAWGGPVRRNTADKILYIPRMLVTDTSVQ